MNDNHKNISLISDEELDSLLDSHDVPLPFEQFTKSVLNEIDKSELYIRLIPIIMGSIGALVTGFFATEKMALVGRFIIDGTSRFSDLSPTPLLFALLLCLPLFVVQFASYNR